MTMAHEAGGPGEPEPPAGAEARADTGTDTGIDAGIDAGDPTAVFDEHRDLLFGVAYRVLGRAVDAEDAVQDAWLRWREVDHASVRDPRAYLVRVVTHLAVDRLRSAQHRRETYVGPWLPEPILTAPDIADDVALADSVSFGMLVVLETLSPLERAVFVLREAFGFSHAEIAGTLGRSEDAVRQLARRARQHVEARRPRFETDRTTQRDATERFLAAANSGDLAGLMNLLAPDVTLLSDGGGVAKAALRVIEGADKVARFLAGIAQKPPPEPRTYLASVNGRLALVVTSRGEPHSVFSLDVVDGRVTTIHVQVNPDKLHGLHDIATVGNPVGLL
ncbi:RNA polymerase sigma-70 factor, ECF subfamily [Actinopolymorpha cephalotaxi]|uniref:RNA polymerase sigma-70 factor (ECF subfamily) n=1 Tax=Actinopolymorpha cephalotaxi TaxID=504797 RepID=A0A1I2UFF0_9ACTN|nr:RNA polymerase sigma-70 factor [Actinopolymorpha cephalotaxi]NYH86516.1 RNA polymerase sigma-70 factor (ECF subfamily) [Actinopolymorpha cephalotaxi]SFG74347.1 RNA polymerase sigma-70 factor, ECF subfamily [Actinopolymorpha cephalotaxi]